MKANTAVILLNWNGWRDTLECLESVIKLEFGQFAIVVVDNASTDGSREQIFGWAERRSGQPFCLMPANVLSEHDLNNQSSAELQHGDFFFIQTDSNGGFAAGNNLGIRLAHARQARYVWLLNNDTVVLPDALTCLVEKAESDGRIGICGSLLRFYHHRNTVQAVGGVKFDFWRARGTQLGQGLDADSPNIVNLGDIEPTYISGASMLVRDEFLSDVGLMEEGYFLYFEEIDWALRGKGKWKMASAPNSIVFHKEGGAIGTASLGTRSSLSQYYLNRNLIRFYWLRCPVLLPIAVARVCREALSCLLRRNVELFGATCKALFDALTGRFGRKARL